MILCLKNKTKQKTKRTSGDQREGGKAGQESTPVCRSEVPGKMPAVTTQSMQTVGSALKVLGNEKGTCLDSD